MDDEKWLDSNDNSNDKFTAKMDLCQPDSSESSDAQSQDMLDVKSSPADQACAGICQYPVFPGANDTRLDDVVADTETQYHSLGEDGDTVLPDHPSLKHVRCSCLDDNTTLDGLVPFEVKPGGGLSEYETLPCELCSPRLYGAEQSERGHDHLDHSWETDEPLMLDQLDDDVLFHIARFLESRTIRFALSIVCKRFYALFGHECYFWKTRYGRQVGSKCRCPTMKTPSTFHAADQCLYWDESHRTWQDTEANTRHFFYSHNVVGVDAVHLMNRGQLLLSGDRNRILNVIDLAKYEGPSDPSKAEMQSMLVHSDRTSHDGWIWTIASVGSTALTGSWDTHIRLFDVNTACKTVADYKCTSAVLSLYAEENEIVASCFDRKLYFIDRRSAEMKHKVLHYKAVLCVTGNDKFIISGSEDKRLSIFDRRAGKVFKVFKLESYPLCLSFSEDQLWFGDRTGGLHLYDGTGDDFKHIGSYSVGHSRKMTGVINTPGAVFTCAGDGTVKVLEPTRNPAVLTSLDCHKKEVADIAYSHGVLASAGADCVGLWLPKYWDRNTYLL